MNSFALLVAAAITSLPVPTPAADFAGAAQLLDAAITARYAYLDRLPGGTLPQSPRLAAERRAVHDHDSLLHYAEDRLATLADHHALTGSNFADSWAVVPTFGDLWVKRADDGAFVVDAVRDGSAAAAAGIAPGDRIVDIDGVPAAAAVAAFWDRLGLAVTAQRADYAARVLVAGRRDRARRLRLTRAGQVRDLVLPSCYSQSGPVPTVTLARAPDRATIRINDSLGDLATIADFDAAMARVPADAALVLDLRETPSGGSTTIARAVMGWFVDRPRAYQIHQSPEEERATGIAHQWTEQVLPRAGKFRAHLPLVLVGRWTGSMGEGLAIGFAAVGAVVQGTAMAGLQGAVEEVALGNTGVSVTFPTERLLTVDGVPREGFRPQPLP